MTQRQDNKAKDDVVRALIQASKRDRATPKRVMDELLKSGFSREEVGEAARMLTNELSDGDVK